MTEHSTKARGLLSIPPGDHGRIAKISGGISILCILFVLHDAWTLPASPIAGWSIVGEMVRTTTGRRWTGESIPFTVVAVATERGSGPPRVVSQYDELFADLTQDETAYHLFYSSVPTRRGFWAPTLETRTRSLSARKGNSYVTSLPTAVIDAIVAWAPGHEIGPWPADATPGVIVTYRVLWYGVAHNATALAVFVVGVLSARSAWRRHRLARLARCLRNRVCHRCGYDLTGLDGGRCPECGSEQPG